jgi:hypothetical protein
VVRRDEGFDLAMGVIIRREGATFSFCVGPA